MTGKQKMDDEKTVDFPLHKAGGQDKILWQCKACNHAITESMEKTEAEGSKVLPLNMGGMMVLKDGLKESFQIIKSVIL